MKFKLSLTTEDGTFIDYFLLSRGAKGNEPGNEYNLSKPLACIGLIDDLKNEMRLFETTANRKAHKEARKRA